MRRSLWLAAFATTGFLAGPAVAQSHTHFPLDQVPAFNIPRMSRPPTIDGRIEPQEWAQAVRLMGVAPAHSNSFFGRPVTFFVAWDPEHLYIAARSDLRQGEILIKQKRERTTMGVVFDDAYEFGLFLFDRNKSAGESSFFFKFILNALLAGEYMRMYPSIGQYLYNWYPSFNVRSRVTEDGRGWEMEIAMGLADLAMPVPHRAGDPLRILLARDFKYPWNQVSVPSATGFLVCEGFPLAKLTEDQPYLQIEHFDGLLDERVEFKSRLVNQGQKPAQVRLWLQVRNEGVSARDNKPLPAKVAFTEERAVTVPPGGEVRFDVEKAIPGLEYGTVNGRRMDGIFEVKVALADAPDAPPIFKTFFRFQKDAKKEFLVYDRKPVPFFLETTYNPIRSCLWLAGDTLDAQAPKDTKFAALSWAVERDGKALAQGKLDRMVHWKYQGLVQLPKLDPGKYQVTCSLLDEGGKPVLTNKETIEKKDEAKAFPEWWGTRHGNPDRVLRPFEPLKVRRRLLGATTIACSLREYELDALGLPRRITSNGGEVLAAPARIVLTIDDTDYVVPTAGFVRVTEADPWRIRFTGHSSVAGVQFTTTGIMEPDGLVDIELTFAPTANPVAIQELRIEWPVDDALQNRVAVMGPGGNYSCRFIGAVPAGQGLVFSTLRHLGAQGSGMTVGNFYQNLWIGTERRGLLWASDSDQGWVPNDHIAAHDLVREAGRLTLRNHLVGTYPGDTPFRLAGPRRVRFQFNASPFKPLRPGWRVNLQSAANGFSGNGYKINWRTGYDGWHLLTPPTPSRAEWPEYYAAWKKEADKLNRLGIYSPSHRLGLWNNNQIPLRGYAPKSLEPGVIEYFAAEWCTDHGETLAETYCDYMTHLMRRQVLEGGCRHFYYDISMVTTQRGLAAGAGYELPDGRLQPTGGCDGLRRMAHRTQAMLQELGISGGLSGHATNSISLKALPWYDAILDSEFPMKDPIDVYPSERMIALSCPENFGCVIAHLGFMNPDWAAMHDANMGGGGGPFLAKEFRHWGIARADVTFVPYWRNREVVRRIGDGLLASIWTRPGSAVIGILNHGPDPEGFEKTRPVELTLNLAALGIPKGASGERLRVRELMRSLEIPTRYLEHLKWVKDIPVTEITTWHKPKLRQPITPKLDPATGALTGFDLGYHDTRYLVIHWETEPIRDADWAAFVPDKVRPAALDWGLNHLKVEKLTGKTLEDAARPREKAFRVHAWKRPGSVLLRVENADKKEAVGLIELDLAKLGVRVDPQRDLWVKFTQAFDLEPGREPFEGIWDSPEAMLKDARVSHQAGSVGFDGWHGHLGLKLAPAQVRFLAIDTY